MLLDVDVLCRQCKYNLRGLDSSGVCPECSLPVVTTLRWHSRLRPRLPFVWSAWLGLSVLASTVLAFGMCLLIGGDRGAMLLQMLVLPFGYGLRVCGSQQGPNIVTLALAALVVYPATGFAAGLLIDAYIWLRRVRRAPAGTLPGH